MLNERIEAAIQRHICSAAVQGPAPTGLHKAIDYSVFLVVHAFALSF